MESVAEQDLTLLSPSDYQVAQRQSAASGSVRISGRVKPQSDAVEVRISGKSSDGADLPDKWQSDSVAAPHASFNAEVKLPAGGWYRLEVRAAAGRVDRCAGGGRASRHR